jgi:predicted phosphodiesterase
MRVFAISDLHVDYAANAKWVAGLSTGEYGEDIAIVAGDVSNSLQQLEWALRTMAARFKKVLFVPGNHELWVIGDDRGKTSLTKFEQVCTVAEQAGVSMQRFYHNGLCIVPLLGWYDYSFGQPSKELLDNWMDYHACRWPSHFSAPDVAAYFEGLNDTTEALNDEHIITFSHFLPRIDVMPEYIPQGKRVVYPVLGATRLDRQVRKLKPKIHVYGHSHMNLRVHIDGVTYVNNAFGYPYETRIASKQLLCVYPDVINEVRIAGCGSVWQSN